MQDSSINDPKKPGYYTEIWMHKKDGRIAEVLHNTWFGRVMLMKETRPGELFSEMDEGDFYFDDMPESNRKFWKVIGIIEEPKTGDK